jgi:glycosyltransferase involved in cell wall biosynthesis
MTTCASKIIAASVFLNGVTGPALMRIHIFDPQLNAAEGHYPDHDAMITRAFEAKGIPSLLYGSRARPPQSAQSTPAIPVFTRQIFDETGTDPVVWPLENFSDLNLQFHRDLATLDPKQFSSSDIAFFPSVLQNQVDGIRQWIMSLDENNRPTVVLYFGWLIHLMPYIQKRANKGLLPLLMRFAVRRLMADHPRTCLFAASDEAINEVQVITDAPVALLPPMIPFDLDGAFYAEKAASTLTVAYVGTASQLKGFHYLPEIITRLQNKASTPRFLIQCYGEGNYISTIEDALRMLPSSAVTIAGGRSERATYLDLLRTADIVLMPYDKKFYGWAASGVLTEALSMGKVVVVPEKTTLSRQLGKFNAGGTTFLEDNATSIANAVEKALTEYPRLKQRALAAAPAWKNEHSSESFVNRILTAAESITTPPSRTPTASPQ